MTQESITNYHNNNAQEDLYYTFHTMHIIVSGFFVRPRHGKVRASYIHMNYWTVICYHLTKYTAQITANEASLALASSRQVIADQMGASFH